MNPDILLNADPAVLHWIEFVAGTSNDIILSRDKALLAKVMLQEAEERLLEKQRSLERKLNSERYFPAYDSSLDNVFVWSFLSEAWTSDTFACLGKNYSTLVKFWIDNFVVDSHPLSISIIAPNSPRYAESLQLFLSHHRRIRCLGINAVTPFLEMPMHSFPILEDLQITICRDDLLLFERSSCFVGMDNLRTLTIFLLHPITESTVTQTTLPWGRLTSLTIEREHLTMLQAVELLKQCTSLQKCRISVQNTSTFTPWTVYLPHLTDLDFVPSRRGYDDKVSLTYYLITPVLKSLTLHVTKEGKPYESARYAKPDIGHVFRHAGDCLHTLNLRGHDALISDADLELERLSYLHTLKASTTVFSDETIHKLTEGILLPNIQKLFIAIDHIDSLEHLATFAEKRSKSSSTVPRLLFLVVVILHQKEIFSLMDHKYFEVCSSRIDDCGTQLALHFPKQV
ncbi:hypothetical protein C0992_007724 [Termitomyces sp. T32_za158]|nr:hypothetical protein C0992_007724 [Termitomyces sp. T32_za158]